MKNQISMFICLLLSLTLITGCATTSSPSVPSESLNADYAGTYSGAAPAYHGTLSVEVELDNAGKILSIVVSEHEETIDIGTVAIDKIPGAIVSAQSLQVDAISGATITGDAIAAAVADALDNAGLTPADYDYIALEGAGHGEVAAPDMSKQPEKAPVTGSLTVTDAKGREITLDMPVSTYAISTMDVIDYIIPLLGEDAFHKLVGSGQDGGGGIQTYEQLYTPIVGEFMPHVGQISDHNAPFDLEMILAMDPDVLLVNSAMGAHNYALEIEPQLTQAGIPIVLINVPGKNFTTSAQDTVKQLGQIFQTEERAAEVVGFLDEQFAKVAAKNLSQRSDKPTVYYEKSGYAEIFGSTNASNSGWGMVIEAAGGENIADALLLEGGSSGGGGGGGGGNSTLDPEYVLQADPDFIVLSGSGAGWMDNFPESTPETPKFDIINRTGWKELKAVKEGRVYELAHASSRSIFGFYTCLKLATCFYPEELSDVDPEAIMQDFFDRFMLVDSNITGWFYAAEAIG